MFHFWCVDIKRNYRAENYGVECRALHRFRCGQCSEIPHSFCGSRGPKRPTALYYQAVCVMLNLL